MFDKAIVFAVLALLLPFCAGHAQQQDPEAPPDEASTVTGAGPVSGDVAGADAVNVDEAVPTEQDLGREFERYTRLLEEGAIDEADTSAKRIVQMTIKLYGPESLETSKALNNLAIVQSHSGQYDAAIQNFERSVEIIETVEDRLNSKLVNPLKGLGAAQLKNGRPDLAARTFNRAGHISRVNEGPHNIEQVEILESLAESTLRAGDTEGARDILDRIFVLNVRHFQNDQMALIPSLLRRAEWQHGAGYFNDERATYRRIIRIIEKNRGKEDPQLILPLRKLGESFYFVDVSDTNPYKAGAVATGEIYFKRAARIAEDAPDVAWESKVEANLALADYYTYAESYNRARRIYTETWAFLSADPERLEARARLLEQPVVLFQKTLPNQVFERNAGGEAVLTGTIRVDYNVSPRGRVRSIRTEASPPEFTEIQRLVHREIRSRIFRPMMVEGEPRVSENLTFEHSFRYRQSDLDSLKAGQQGEPTTST